MERAAFHRRRTAASTNAPGLLRDLKSNLLDNGTFRREFEKILKDKRLSDKLRGELAQIATAATQPEGHA